MANDYTIYLKSKAIEKTSEHTKPFSSRDEQDESVAPFVTQAVSQVGGGISSGGSSLASQAMSAGVSALSKVAPWIAVAIAVVKVADKVATEFLSSFSDYTGDYSNNVNYNNFKNVVTDIINPTAMGKKIIDLTLQRRKQNLEAEQRRLLTGAITYRNFANRGV